MSEHAQRAVVSVRERPVAARALTIEERGADWPLATLFFGIVVALYAMIAVVIYVLATTFMS